VRDQCGCDMTVAGRMSDQREQDSNPGGWRKGRFIYASGPAPGSLHNGAYPLVQGCWVFMPQNVEASKQEGQKQMWQLAFHWEVTIYHTSTRLQLITLAHLWQKDIRCFSWNGLKQGPAWGGALTCL
jgi:hypothetical protein